MTNLIEEADRRQQRYWRGFLIALCLSVTLLAVRALFYYAFNEQILNSQPIGIAVLIATIITMVIAAYFMVMLIRLKSKISADPQLKEALINDELANLHALKSWKSAFIGAVVTPYVFLFASSFYSYCDLLSVALTTTIVGSVAYLISYHLRGRA